MSLMIKALEPSTDTRPSESTHHPFSISLSFPLYISAPLSLSSSLLQFQPPFLNEEGYRNGFAIVSHCGSIDGFKTSDCEERKERRRRVVELRWRRPTLSLHIVQS